MPTILLVAGHLHTHYTIVELNIFKLSSSPFDAIFFLNLEIRMCCAACAIFVAPML